MRNIIYFFTAGLFVLCLQHATAQQRPASAYVDSMLFRSFPENFQCGVDAQLKELRKQRDFAIREQAMNAAILQKKLNGPNDPIITLPVVFHIMRSDPNSVSDQQIADAIKDLNDAFSKSGNYAASLGADTRIRFKLAAKDPNGGRTTGINRVYSYYGSNLNNNIEDGAMKDWMVWDPSRYINIWVVENIVSELSAYFSCGVWTRSYIGGYATLPVSGTPSQTDGIVVPGFGIVLAHEMGHYLGLYHTFEGGCTNGNCDTDGDKVCDTPPDGTTFAAPRCDSANNSCTTDTLSNYSNGFFKKDVPDQIANFMDYGNTSCSNLFTEGQSIRMRNAVAALRPKLLDGDQLVAPCSDNIIVKIDRTKPYPKTGEAINFSVSGTGSFSSYQWLVNDTSYGTGATFSRTFYQSKKNKVVVKVTTASGCTAAYTDYVTVNCGLDARFSHEKRTIASKTGILNDTVFFKNNSYSGFGSGTSYEWYISNESGAGRNLVTSNAAGGTANDLNYIFPKPGFYNIKLLAINGTCRDSTFQDYIYNNDPTQDAFISITNVNCYQETKVRVGFYVCNFGYASIPANIPVTFYDADPKTAGAKQIGSTFLVPDEIKGYCCSQVFTSILDLGYRGLNQIYAAVGDKGGTVPLVLPSTTMVEKDYTNNIASSKDFRFRISLNTTDTTLEPGDAVPLIAQTLPDPTSSSSFLWSTAAGLSCTRCSSPVLLADTNITKQVIATSQYQCFDTAKVIIRVPPPNDYTVSISGISCAGADSLLVNFTIANGFRRGIIPKKLRVAFYTKDPSQSGAVLLSPVFIAPDSVQARQKSYSVKIKKTAPGNVYAAVNDTANQLPVTFPNTYFLEKNYTNNISSFVYTPVTKVIDTTICNGDTVLGYSKAGTYSDMFTTAGGCDSVRVLNVTVRSASVARITRNISICQGESFEGYSASGVYVNKFKTVAGCDSIRTLVLTVNPIVRKTVTAGICRGATYFAGGRLQTTSGTYTDSLKSVTGCDSIVTTILTVHPLPSRFLPPDTSICISKTLLLNLSAYKSVVWTNGAPGNTLEITDPGVYGAIVTDNNGCVGSDSVTVVFQKCIPIQVPNAFSPNGDYRNDIFRPLIGAVISNYRMQIWNRWGQLVFQTTEIGKGWNGRVDGQDQPQGTYIYMFTFRDPDGVETVKRGTVLLIR
jgi:gliding motility-associated-like protein